MKDLIGCGCCHWISFFVSLEFMNVVHPTDNKVKKNISKKNSEFFRNYVRKYVIKCEYLAVYYSNRD